jgi:hypothetical protein
MSRRRDHCRRAGILTADYFRTVATFGLYTNVTIDLGNHLRLGSHHPFAQVRHKTIDVD